MASASGGCEAAAWGEGAGGPDSEATAGCVMMAAQCAPAAGLPTKAAPRYAWYRREAALEVGLVRVIMTILSDVTSRK